jgi:hypothetical protein
VETKKKDKSSNKCDNKTLEEIQKKIQEHDQMLEKLKKKE